MGFFAKSHKELARKNPSGYLQRKYEHSERQLKYYASIGDKKKLKQIMKEHAKWEYAMLYQQTPEYRRFKR